MSHVLMKKNEIEPKATDVWGLQSNINRLFDAFMNPFDESVFTDNKVMPKLDIAELKDKYEIKAELPGMDENDINLSLEDGVLKISGEKKSETENKEKGYYLKECSYGSFSRSVRLPDNISEDEIAANFRKGVLTIDMPKKAQAISKSKKIKISAK